MDESCHVSYMWTRHVANMDESCHVSYMGTLHVANMDESCHVSYMCITQVLIWQQPYPPSQFVNRVYVNASCRKYGWVLSNNNKYHWSTPMATSHILQHSSWFMHMCDVCRHDSFACVIWFIHTQQQVPTRYSYGNSNPLSLFVIQLYVRHASSIFATWLIQICDMNHSNAWHDSFTCEKWLTCTSATAIAPITVHDTYICVTWPTQICYVPHSYVSYDSFICLTWLTRTSATAISPKTVSKNLAMLRVVATCMWLSSWQIHVFDRSWLMHMCQHSLKEFNHVACCYHLYIIEFVTHSWVL